MLRTTFIQLYKTFYSCYKAGKSEIELTLECKFSDEVNP